MKRHRRKIALALALILAIGSAAASAANIAGGRSAIPSFAGAGDAVEMALGMAGKASNWMIDRSRQAVGSAFSYAPPNPVRPPEVPYVADPLPLYQRGTAIPVTPRALPPYGRVASDEPDNTLGPTFENGLAPRAMNVASVAPQTPSLPDVPGSSGGGSRDIVTTSLATPITTPVPELPPFAMLLAGLGLLAPAIRRRQKSRTA
jgi:hypothetical protein